MNYREFLDLPEDVRDDLIKTYRNQREIRSYRLELESDMDLIRERMVINQKNCKHPMVEKTNRSDTGNYDPGCDSYWKDCYCPDCGKRWRED